MALSMVKKKPGFFVTGTDCVGKDVDLFISNEKAETYLHLVGVEKALTTGKAYQAEIDALEPDPREAIYLKFFGKDKVAEDPLLRTVLVEPQEARNGVELNWEADPVALALHLIDKGASHRLRLMGEELIDMGEDEPDSVAVSIPETLQGPTGPTGPITTPQGDIVNE